MWTKEKMREYGKAYRYFYYRMYPERIKAQSLAYRKKYPERFKRYVQTWRDNNPETYHQAYRKRYKKNQLAYSLYSMLKSLLQKEGSW